MATEYPIAPVTALVIFLLLNLVIGTIAFTSYRSSSAAADPSAASKLFRSPSLVLDRLKSFNLYSSYRPSDLATTTEIPKSEECVAEPEPEPQPEQQEHHIVWSQSDAQPTAGEMPKKLAKKLKKLATLKSAFNHFDFHEPPEQESSPPKRPATMREGEREKEEAAAADQVDAMADDFINRFKQQLKLQRLDSIIRYREMLNCGN